MQTYVQIGLTATGMPMDVYREALVGFYNLQQRGLVSAQRQVLTIIDFSRSSRLKRLWVVDVKQRRVLFHTLVAHGKNTGEEFASAFSNQNGSEMSSLGFYVTGNTYSGKHGLSLKLNGLDPGYNTNAGTRAVVVHGAEYVCEEFVRQHGRLGRSQGCPALPMQQSSAIIQAIKGHTVVYAHAPRGVRYQSELQQLDPALVAFAQSAGLAED
ncbi:murein L,D-transpeptidase catalytic domain family protein [Hymenobacter algoricola]|uniref:Murein L,D-transpeptidase catalytic domain family protein n=1 Tax=Hymenobacter algoricola TaxID=486267 RepID=A0ABP7NB49_9BACT